MEKMIEFGNLELVRRHLIESAAVKQQLADTGAFAIVAAATRLAEAVRKGGKILLCGNGGSAADCQHIAAELTNRLRASAERPGIPAISLTTDTSFLTARANDYGFDDVYERLVDALGKPGDALIGISTSGTSRNVVRAVARARERGLLTVGLLGEKAARWPQSWMRRSSFRANRLSTSRSAILPSGTCFAM